MLKDVEVQKANLLTLQNSLSSMSDSVNAAVYKGLEEPLIHIEHRFLLVNLYFDPCDGDDQYNEMLCDFVNDHLKSCEELLERCEQIREKNDIQPTEDEVSRECNKAKVTFHSIKSSNLSVTSSMVVDVALFEIFRLFRKSIHLCFYKHMGLIKWRWENFFRLFSLGK